MFIHNNNNQRKSGHGGERVVGRGERGEIVKRQYTYMKLNFKKFDFFLLPPNNTSNHQ